MVPPRDSVHYPDERDPVRSTAIANFRRGGVHCTDDWSPWPWLGIGLLLVVAGAVVFLSSRAVRRV
jgi:hypothetical protein